MENGEEGVEGRGVDHVDVSLEEWPEKFVRDVQTWCRDKFRRPRRGGPAVFANLKKGKDYETLLKVGALVVVGAMPEAWVEGAVEAVLHHTGKPLTDRVSYFCTVLSDVANKDGVTLNRLLASVRVPQSLRKR